MSEAGSPAEEGRLLARPRNPPAEGLPWPLPPGLHPLGQGGARDGKLRVPAGLPPGSRLPLIVMLHGATGNAERALRRISAIADQALVMLPESLGTSWDILEGGYGPDVGRLDEALHRIFAAWPVDPERLAIAGFSDGASYALSLALMNGTLFSHCLAFSPGFVAPVRFEGRPALFVSHGVEDEVLPIDACSRRLMPKLERAGYYGQYMEFPGKHEVPEEVQQAGLAFLLAGAEAGPE
jgi:phospholipase/carboxylesterase